MADNVTFQSAVPATPPAGFQPATDDVGGVHYQKIKIDLGGDGVSVPVVGSMPVTMAAVPLTPLAPASAVVSGVSAQVVAENANRKGLVLINRSALAISVAFGFPAVLDAGISLEPYGGVFTMTKDTLATGQVNAIATGAAVLAVQEYE